MHLSGSIHMERGDGGSTDLSDSLNLTATRCAKMVVPLVKPRLKQPRI